MKEVLLVFCVGGIICIEDDDVIEFVYMLKMMVSFWILYIKVCCLSGELVREDIYNGILKVLLLLKVYCIE